MSGQNVERTLRSPYSLVDEPAITAPEFLLQRAELHVQSGKGEQTWLIDAITGDSFTFADFIRISTNVANWFYANGMRKGDTVIFLPLNFTKMHFIFGGAWRANGVMRASYPEDTAETLLDRVEESKAKFIYCESAQAEQVLGVVAQCDWPIQVIVNGNAENCVSVDDVMQFQGEESPTLEVTPDDPALILCTSGTTGKAKGAVRTHRNVVNIYRAHQVFPWGEKPLIVSKGTHISGASIGLGNLASGKTTIVVWRFTTKDIFGSIHKYKPDFLFSFPTYVMAMVSDADAKNYDFSSVKQLLTAGVVISSAMVDKIMQLSHLERILNMYGLTETIYCIANVHYSPDGTREIVDTPPGSVGLAFPGREIQIRDQETGEVLAPGQKGEICIKSGDMFSYYLNSPQATKDSFTEDGFFKTGDIGSYDQNGCITVFGRAKEVFKCSGNHVSPGYLDEVISQHPAISEVCTVGVILEGGVEAVPRAFVTLKAGHEGTTVKEITEFAHGKLADYMHLRGGLYIVPQLPRGPTGKVTRNLVSQLKVD